MKIPSKTLKNSKKTLRKRIREAFLEAAAKEKGPFNLKGRGSEDRVTLDRKLAAVLRGLELPRVHISGFGAKYMYPLRVVKRAATVLRQTLGFEVVGYNEGHQCFYLDESDHRDN